MSNDSLYRSVSNDSLYRLKFEKTQACVRLKLGIRDDACLSLNLGAKVGRVAAGHAKVQLRIKG